MTRRTYGVKKREGRPALTVRMDGRQLRRLYRVAKRLERPDASVLIRELVDAIVNGDTAKRRVFLNDLVTRLDALEAKHGLLPLVESDSPGEALA